MMVKATMSVRFNLVVPLAPPATVTRATDTTGQLDLFGRSGAVTPSIGAARRFAAEKLASWAQRPPDDVLSHWRLRVVRVRETVRRIK